MRSSGGRQLLQVRHHLRETVVATQKYSYISPCHLPGVGSESPSRFGKEAVHVCRNIQLRPTRVPSPRQLSLFRHQSNDSAAADSGETDPINYDSVDTDPIDDIRDCKDDPIMVASRTNGDARATFFAYLRLMLVQDGPSAENIWVYLKTARWMQKFERAKLLSDYERSLLSEALQLIIRQCFHHNVSSVKDVLIPRRTINLFRTRGLMQNSDWATSLAALSNSLYAVSAPAETVDFSGKVVALFDMNLLLSEVLLVWKSFMWQHQRADSRGNVDELEGRMWSFLKSHSASSSDISKAVDYSTRFLGFAPMWPQGGDPFADRQILCSSVMALASITKWLNLKTALTHAIPSQISSLSVDVLEHNIWSTENLEIMSKDELSFLQIMTHAANSESTNYTVLKLALARTETPAMTVGSLINHLKDFKSSVTPTRVTQELYHKTPTTRKYDIFLTHRSRKPLAVLMAAVSQGFQKLEDVDALWKTCLKLNPKYPKDSASIARVVAKEYWRFGCADQALEVIETFPALRNSKKLWIRALVHHFREKDFCAFESTWAGPSLEGQFIPEEIWRLRLEMYHEYGELSAFRQVFKRMYWLSRESDRVVRNSETVERTTHMTVGTFDMVIRLLLKDGLGNAAEETFDMLRQHPEARPSEQTYAMFVDFYLNSDNFDPGRATSFMHLKRQAGYEVSDTDCCTWLIRCLQTWPLSARWADPTEIFSAIGRALTCRHGQYGPKARVKTSGTHESTLSEKCIGPSPPALALSIFATYDGLYNAIVTKIRDTRGLRAALVLHDHLHKYSRHLREEKGFVWPKKVDFTSRLLELTISSPRRDQLALLSGGLYLSPLKANGVDYDNFPFVRKVWAAGYISKYFEALGLDEYGDKLRSIDWYGFHQFNQQKLFNAGIVSASARSRILLELTKLRDEAEFYAKEIMKELSADQQHWISFQPPPEIDYGYDKKRPQPSKFLFPKQRERIAKIKAGQAEHRAHLAAERPTPLRIHRPAQLEPSKRAMRRGQLKLLWATTTDPVEVPPPKREGRERWLATRVKTMRQPVQNKGEQAQLAKLSSNVKANTSQDAL